MTLRYSHRVDTAIDHFLSEFETVLFDVSAVAGFGTDSPVKKNPTQ